MEISSRSREFIAWWRSAGGEANIPSCTDINLEQVSGLLKMVQYLKWSETGELVTSMLGTELDKLSGGSRTGRCALELTHRDAKEESREFFTRLEEQPSGAVVNLLFREGSGLARHYEMVILPVLDPGHRNRLLAFVEPGEIEPIGIEDMDENVPRILAHGAIAFIDIGEGTPLKGSFGRLKSLELDARGYVKSGNMAVVSKENGTLSDLTKFDEFVQSAR